jgi:pyruvate kinase
VTEISSPTAIRIKVLNNGILMSKKGINLPDTDFGGDILTPKDIEDIQFGAQQDIDYVALSFVQSEADIHAAREILTASNSSAQVIAKIETKAAISEEVLEPIIEASDGVMIARGDLAVEAGAEVVPVVQRQIIALCRKHAKLSIVATQMMASMVATPEPTRAEVSDVATAVILGADTVMLSDETANGQFPTETVGAMKRVIVYTQDHADVSPIHTLVRSESAKSDAISVAAVSLAVLLEVAVIVAETKTGATAANVSAHRPDRPILCVTSDPRVAQQLALWYGTKIVIAPDGEHIGLQTAETLKSQGFFGDHDSVSLVVISGTQPGIAGTTNTIQFQKI